MHRLFLFALLPLAACATPAQRCERAALEDLRTIDRLISETQANIDRGYAIGQEFDKSPRLQVCLGRGWGHRTRGGVVLCNHDETVVREKPVAIDIKAEEAKLRSLRTKRIQTAQRSARELSACRAQHGPS